MPGVLTLRRSTGRISSVVSVIARLGMFWGPAGRVGRRRSGYRRAAYARCAIGARGDDRAHAAMGDGCLWPHASVHTRDAPDHVAGQRKHDLLCTPCPGSAGIVVETCSRSPICGFSPGKSAHVPGKISPTRPFASRHQAAYNKAPGGALAVPGAGSACAIPRQPAAGRSATSDRPAPLPDTDRSASKVRAAITQRQVHRVNDDRRQSIRDGGGSSRGAAAGA